MSTLLNVIAGLIVIPVYMTLYLSLLTANWFLGLFVKEVK